MTTALEEVTKSAMQLPARQRLVLASCLLESDRMQDDSSIGDVWEQEIRKRIQAVDAGNTTGVSCQEVMRRAEQLLVP